MAMENGRATWDFKGKGTTVQCQLVRGLVTDGNRGAVLRLLSELMLVFATMDVILWQSLVAMASYVWHVPWWDIGRLRRRLGMRAEFVTFGSADIGRQLYAMVIERNKRKPPWPLAVVA